MTQHIPKFISRLIDAAGEPCDYTPSVEQIVELIECISANTGKSFFDVLHEVRKAIHARVFPEGCDPQDVIGSIYDARTVKDKILAKFYIPSTAIGSNDRGGDHYSAKCVEQMAKKMIGKPIVKRDMKLWLLRPLPEYANNGSKDVEGPWKNVWDCLHGIVVRAETESEARQAVIDSREYGDEVRDTSECPWTNPHYSTCEELTADGVKGVIIRDFWSA